MQNVDQKSVSNTKEGNSDSATNISSEDKLESSIESSIESSVADSESQEEGEVSEVRNMSRIFWNNIN